MNKNATMDVCRSPQQGATIIDLSANPYDVSPTINHLVTTIQDARAADQKVIVMLGEEHSTISYVSFAMLLRSGLQDGGSKDKPVLAQEQRHNLLELFLPRLFKGDPSSFQDAARHALNRLKQDDPKRYHHLQALTFASLGWPLAPVAQLESVSGWLRQKFPVRLMDMAMTTRNQIDINNPETAKFVKTNPAEGGASLDGGEPNGMRLRNLWMMASLREIIEDHNIVLLQTGLAHLGGSVEDGNLYEHALHGLGVQTEHDAKIITVFPECRRGNITFKTMLSPEAQQAMNNSDTIILRGGNEAKHRQGRIGSISREAATLRRIFNASGLPDHELSVNDANDYKRKTEGHKTALRAELDRIITAYPNAP